ncbi:MAG: hypothetical protein ACOVLE_12495 [Pirellula staleyi]|jgi:hypothetical protein
MTIQAMELDAFERGAIYAMFRKGEKCETDSLWNEGYQWAIHFRDFATHEKEKAMGQIDSDALSLAIERGGYDVSPCLICQELVICIPDGLAMCEKCAEKAGG